MSSDERSRGFSGPNFTSGSESQWWYDPFTVERDLARLLALCLILTAVVLLQLEGRSGARPIATSSDSTVPYASR